MTRFLPVLAVALMALAGLVGEGRDAVAATEEAPPEAAGEAAETPPAPAPERKAPPTPAAPALTPDQIEAQRLAVEGTQQLQQGDLPRARELLEQALELDPDNVLAHTFTAFLSFRRGAMVRARDHAVRVLELAPESPLVLLIMGRLEEVSGAPDSAIEFYRRASRAGRSSPTAEADGGAVIAAHSDYLMALLLEEEGGHAEALAALEGALKVFPKNVNARYETGRVLLAMGRAEEAAEAFARVLEDRPAWTAPEAWLFPLRRYLFLEENALYWKAVAAGQAGRAGQAVEELKAILPVVESRLAGETAGDDGSPGALRLLEGALDLSYYDAHMDLARLLAGLGRQEEAVATLKTLVRVKTLSIEREKRAKQLIKEIR